MKRLIVLLLLLACLLVPLALVSVWVFLTFWPFPDMVEAFRFHLPAWMSKPFGGMTILLVVAVMAAALKTASWCLSTLREIDGGSQPEQD